MKDHLLQSFLEQTAKDYDMPVYDVKCVYDVHGIDGLYQALEDIITVRGA